VASGGCPVGWELKLQPLKTRLHAHQTLNHQLRREIHISRQPPGYFVPIDLVRAGTAGIATFEQRPHLTVLP
jgi:hypothetical protein